jgi:hypothetical protein
VVVRWVAGVFMFSIAKGLLTERLNLLSVV